MRRRIGVIAAITRQIGRMRPTCGRRAADARPTLPPTMNRPLVACLFATYFTGIIEIAQEKTRPRLLWKNNVRCKKL